LKTIYYFIYVYDVPASTVHTGYRIQGVCVYTGYEYVLEMPGSATAYATY